MECLNSVAPPPLNWKMWCPGKDAKVMGWTDKSGAAHRSITLRPQKNMTSTMATWFITTHVLGLMPPVVEFQGNVSVWTQAQHCMLQRDFALYAAAAAAAAATCAAVLSQDGFAAVFKTAGIMFAAWCQPCCSTAAPIWHCQLQATADCELC